MRASFGRHPLITILAVAFLLRAATGAGVQALLERSLHRTFLIPGDADGYWELGRRLAHREPFAVHDPPRYAMRMPGFPAFLAVCQAACSGAGLDRAVFWITRLALASVGACGCGLVYLLGRILFDDRVGLVAAGVTAISPAAIGFSVLILSETLFAVGIVANLVVVALLLEALRGGSAPSTRTWLNGLRPSQSKTMLTALMAGVLGAAACYVRPSWLLAVPALAMLALVVALRARSGALTAAAAAGLMLFGLILALLPWGLRNQRVTGHFVLTTLWVGPSLYDGLNPQADGTSDMRFFDRDRLMPAMSEYEVDRHYRRLAWDFVQENPGRAVALGFRKLARYASPWPNASEVRSAWIRVPIALFSVATFAAAALGAWSRRSDPVALLLCAGPLVYFAAIHAVFVGSLRYRLPAEYPLYVLTAAGVVRCWRSYVSPAGLAPADS